MFSPKRFIILILSGLMLASCTSTRELERRQGAEVAAVRAKAAQAKKEEELRLARVKANKEAADRRAKLAKKSAAATNRTAKSKPKPKKTSTSSSSTTRKTTTTSKPTAKKTVSKPKPKTSSKYRKASSIPGKPGFVFNPWTNKAVDVRGIPAGSVVRDPNDGNPDHKFRVP